MARLDNVLRTMLDAAETEAGNQWRTISGAVSSEFQIFAQRLAQIAAGRAANEITDEDARDFFSVAHNNLIAMIAMTTTLVFAAVQKIVNAALAAAKEAINSFMRFPLILV